MQIEFNQDDVKLILTAMDCFLRQEGMKVAGPVMAVVHKLDAASKQPPPASTAAKTRTQNKRPAKPKE